ncbi:MAG: NUDIX hydrolase [Flammeovirgaceae bacterium]|nr:NUDIX hydrolase [Flammeovirgaceae bacterium]
MNQPVQKIAGNRLRVRACGVLADEEGIILVNHRGLYQHSFWAPPGGGINFGESVTKCLVREFKEETSLDIEIEEFLFSTEFIRFPIHALELFFKVHKIGGVLKSGNDPEFKDVQGYSLDVKKMTWPEIELLKKEELHGSFARVKSGKNILDLRGYLIL